MVSICAQITGILPYTYVNGAYRKIEYRLDLTISECTLISPFYCSGRVCCILGSTPFTRLASWRSQPHCLCRQRVKLFAYQHVPLTRVKQLLDDIVKWLTTALRGLAVPISMNVTNFGLIINTHREYHIESSQRTSGHDSHMKWSCFL